MLKFKPTFSFVLALNIIVTSSLAAILFTGDAADAAKPQGYYQGRPYYKDSRGRLIDYKTGKILKGGLIGAGIGAGAGLLTGRSVGRTALVGGGVGAGVQATRHSEFMKKHPIARTATYGALTGAGASTVVGDGKGLGKGLLWGAGIGTGVGVLKHAD